MSQKQSSSNLHERVIRAAEAVLDHDGSVGPLELLQAMQLLQPVHVQSWRNGHEQFTSLEPWIQGSPEKLAKAFQFFREWIETRGLKAIEATYERRSPRGSETLQVTRDGDPTAEQFFRTHFAPADLPQRRAEKIQQKLSKPPELVVFETVGRDSKCSECQAELGKGSFLFMEKGQPLCLACADLDHLEYLPRGDATVTRRSRKYSQLAAVVVRFSRSRNRYERQGILVTAEAIARAESECEADADVRAAQRIRAAKLREADDTEFTSEMFGAIRTEFPACPADEARRIAEHTTRRSSGRVGRSAAGRALDPTAVRLAVVASIRHNHTDYDHHLMAGTDRETARDMVRAEIDRVLAEWSEPLTEANLAKD